MTQYAHCRGAEERFRPDRVKKTLADLWQENGIDYILKVHVYIEILIFSAGYGAPGG